MPGLCGYAFFSQGRSADRAALERMRHALACRPYHCSDPVFVDGPFGAARTHPGIIQNSRQPFSRGGIHVWLDGEFYDADTRPDAERTDPEILCANYAAGNLIPFLRTVDGIFSAVIYDAGQQTLRLLCDRYGLCALYVGLTSAGLFWASELKAFRHAPRFPMTISKECVAEFMRTGHCMGAATWFSGVELLDPATVICLDLRTSRLERVRYWHWSDLPPCVAPRDLDETARKLGECFRRAVVRRCRRGERIGVGLSGGLDSRAIFAALPPFVEPVEAYTFGKRECADIRIAQQVAALRPSRQRICHIDPDDWLDRRVEGVWRTDGQFNLLHLHGAGCAEEHRDFFDIRLNGFLGDALLGGAYGGHPGGEIERFRNRGRRFIALGYSWGNFACHTRIPFFDNELLELTLSIPWSFRRNSSMYRRMLLATFPEYFSSIPWQKTGLPISKIGAVATLHGIARRAVRKIGGFLPFIQAADGYAEYSAWLRRPHARGFLDRLLGHRDALLFEFVDPRAIELRLCQHDAGFDCADALGRYLTFELWLRQFFQNEFMDFSAEGVRRSLSQLDE